MASRLQSAKEAQARAEARVTALEKDLSDLQQQVGPVVNLVEEARSNAQHGRNMTRQRQHMLQGLVQRARAVGDDLRIEVPDFAAGGSDDEAAYTFFFEEFLGKLEEIAKDFDERVVEESRDLLVIATSRIFSNLARLQPSLDLEAVTAPVNVTDRALGGCRGVRQEIRPSRGRRGRRRRRGGRRGGRTRCGRRGRLRRPAGLSFFL